MAHTIRTRIEAYTLLSSLYPSLPVGADVFGEVSAGTGAADADTTVLLTYSLAAAGTQTIDLTSVTGPNGETISFAEVHILTAWSPTAAAQFTIKDGASNPWEGMGTDYAIQVSTLPATPVAVTGGYPVASDSKTILLTNEGASTATINLIIVGRD